MLSLSLPNTIDQSKSMAIKGIINHFAFTPTPGQITALSKLNSFLHSNDSFFLLGGYAGTGKSSVIFAVIKELIIQSKRVGLTAPTNKAVGILRKMAAANGLHHLSCQTIHQLLGLGLTNQGKEKILDQVSPSSLHLYDVIFLDECSMVGMELWQWLSQEFAGNLLNQRKLILMGDPAQLNPVGEQRSPTFQVRPRAILTTVVRQAGDNPLLDLISVSRRMVKSKTKLFLPYSSYRQGDKLSGAFKVKNNTLIKHATRKIKRHFTNNPDCYRILCYTNKRVAYYNQIIREQLYGKNSPQFVLGERLITKKPVVAPNGKTVILPTSTEVTVTDISQTKHCGYRVWQLKVETDEGSVQQILTLHAQEYKRYQAELDQKLKSAQRNPYLWRKYYWWRDDVFAEVLNCFALTIHNSQGSTFDEGAIDGNDILTRLFVGDNESEQQKRREHNRLWYVGSSRFRQRLLFIAPKENRIEQVLVA